MKKIVTSAITELNMDVITSNPVNPRTIKTEKFKQLLTSITEFPDMLKMRPVVVDEEGMILGGNMRYLACKELQHKTIWVQQVEGLTKQQKDEFIIKDNVNYGQWDYDILANTWEQTALVDWGVEMMKHSWDDLQIMPLKKNEEPHTGTQLKLLIPITYLEKIGAIKEIILAALAAKYPDCEIH